MKLREYQSRIINDARLAMLNGARRLIIQAPTGSGKTVLTAFMVKQSLSKGMRAWFTCHRRELIEQTCRTFAEVDIPFGVISPHHPREYDKPVQIASIQTLARRLDDPELEPPRLLIQDEAHHTAAAQWARVHERCTEAFKVGLTATPARLDGKGLHPWFDEIVEGPKVKELVEQGFLSPFKFFAPAQPDTSGIRRMAGDFAKDQLAEMMDKPSITGCAIDHYQRLCPGRQALAFCINIEHSVNTAALFRERGISAIHLDGKSPKAERQDVMDRFRRGDVQVVSNCDLFSEGLDVPGVEAAVLLRPTQSLTLYLQQVGRSLRPKEHGGKAIILDHAGNVYRHGMPDDEREWTLADKPKVKRNAKQEVHIKTCPQCFACHHPSVAECDECGYVFEAKPRNVERRDGELLEIQSMPKQSRMSEQMQCETFEDLVRLGKRRGYKHPYGWAKHVFANRRAKSQRVC